LRSRAIRSSSHPTLPLIHLLLLIPLFFFFNDTATTEIYTLSLHDALPICDTSTCAAPTTVPERCRGITRRQTSAPSGPRSRVVRSEEHTSELQSLTNLVCRLLLEKKKQQTTINAGETTERSSVTHSAQ